MTNKTNLDFWEKYAWNSNHKRKNTAELPTFVNVPHCAEIEVHPEVNALTVRYLDELYENNPSN